MQTRGERLRSARLAFFRSSRSAAQAIGVPVSTLNSHERAGEPGGRDFDPDYTELYARRFQVSPEWLLTGRGKDEAALNKAAADSPLIHVPLVSWVSAGKLAEANSPAPVQDVPLLAFSDLGRGDFIALRVSGDSMDRVSPDGSIIIVNRSDKRLQRDKPYVFSIRGEATYKYWEPDPVPRLEPRSFNPANKPIFVGEDEMEVVGRVRRTMFDL